MEYPESHFVIPNRLSRDRGSVIQSDVFVWTIIDGILLVMILCGNTLTILAVRFSRRLRSVISNMFILSLAISDMVVGLTLPYHLAFYMGSDLGTNKCYCLLRFFLIIFACCVSIWNLIAIAVDRYIAIVYPLHYSRYITKKVALTLIGMGWFVGVFIAIIPIFWNRWSTAKECEFDEVLYPWYMAGVITPIFSLVWICLSIVYFRIWREASKHAKQLRSSFTGKNETPSDWKSIQVVLLILGCFTICWLPYFIVACAQIHKIFEDSSPTLYKATFSLAMANSSMNPLIYAWKNSNFRRAFGHLLRCKGPDSADPMQSIRSNLHRKSSSMHNQDILNGSMSNFSTPPSFQKNEKLSSKFIDEYPIDTVISITNINSGAHILMKSENKINNIKKHKNNDKTDPVIRNSKMGVEIYKNNNNNKICNKNNLNNECNNSSNTITVSNTQKLNKEITMGNIIVNKCAIIEHLENCDKEYFSKNFHKNNINENQQQNKITKPIECVLNEQNDTIIYKINLVNEQKKINNLVKN